MPVRRRTKSRALHIKSAAFLRKTANYLFPQEKAVRGLRKKARNFLVRSSKKVLYDIHKPKGDLAISLQNLEIYESGVDDFIDQVRREKKYRQNKKGRISGQTIFSNLGENIVAIKFPALKGRGIYLPEAHKLNRTLRRIASLHNWIRETQNETVSKVRKNHKYFYVNKRNELVFTNDASRALKIFVPALSLEAAQRYERAFSFYGISIPLIFQRLSSPKTIYLLASGEKALQVKRETGHDLFIDASLNFE